ncbi:MAG: hypothetical protein H0X25_11650 [Acidobacteriales bacterium]|nr:hypothetical protein [Terriglobales bacterium]
MDLLWFLRRRLKFINRLYNQTTGQFYETMNNIQSGEPPFVDERNPEFDNMSDPPFLEEYQEAAESAEVIGHWCLCMVYGSLKAYLEAYIDEMSRDYVGLSDLRKCVAAKKAKSWFGRYRIAFLEDISIDWAKGPVRLSELEHLNLSRDDVTHNIDVTSIYAYQTDKHAGRYPQGLFIDEEWAHLNLGGRIRLGPDELVAALTMVDEFCAWLEDIRLNYRGHVQAVRRAAAATATGETDRESHSLD